MSKSAFFPEIVFFSSERGVFFSCFFWLKPAGRTGFCNLKLIANNGNYRVHTYCKFLGVLFSHFSIAFTDVANFALYSLPHSVRIQQLTLHL